MIPQFSGRFSLVVVFGLVTLGGVGCSGTEKGPTSATTVVNAAAAPSYSSEIIETPPGVIEELSSTVVTAYSKYEDGVAVVASLLDGNQKIDVFADETATAPEQTIERTTTSEIVFLAVGGTPERLYVHLPTRPNGSMGWINKSDVLLQSNYFAVEVKLSDFKLSVFEKGKKIHEAKIGIGKEEAPSPDGFYYTIFSARPKTPDTVYGNYVIGLSGFSEVYETFGTGIGRLGLHGTNRPDLLGQRVSNGCIRMDNADIDYLVERLPLGTPVKIIA